MDFFWNVFAIIGMMTVGATAGIVTMAMIFLGRCDDQD